METRIVDPWVFNNDSDDKWYASPHLPNMETLCYQNYVPKRLIIITTSNKLSTFIRLLWKYTNLLLVYDFIPVFILILMLGASLKSNFVIEWYVLESSLVPLVYRTCLSLCRGNCFSYTAYCIRKHVIITQPVVPMDGSFPFSYRSYCQGWWI